MNGLEAAEMGNHLLDIHLEDIWILSVLLVQVFGVLDGLNVFEL